MDPGTFKDRVIIEQRRDTEDSLGAVVEDWSANGPARWASIEPQSGRENFAAERTQAEVSVRVIMRHAKPLPTATMRLRGASGQYDGEIFDILSVVAAKGREKTLVLNCRQRPVGGTP